MQYIVICYILFYSVKRVVNAGLVKTQLVYIFGMFSIWFIIESLFLREPNMPFLKARQMFAFPCGMFVAEYKDRVETRFKENALIYICGGGYNRDTVYGNNTVAVC